MERAGADVWAAGMLLYRLLAGHGAATRQGAYKLVTDRLDELCDLSEQFVLLSRRFVEKGLDQDRENELVSTARRLREWQKCLVAQLREKTNGVSSELLDELGHALQFNAKDRPPVSNFRDNLRSVAEGLIRDKKDPSATTEKKRKPFRDNQRSVQTHGMKKNHKQQKQRHFRFQQPHKL